MSSSFCGLFLSLAVFHSVANAATIRIVDEKGKPLPLAMVTQFLVNANKPDVSDNGYPTPGKPFRIDPEVTMFSDSAGVVRLPDRAENLRYRVRKPHFQDASIEVTTNKPVHQITMRAETDASRLADAKPANVWLGALNIGDGLTKKHFQMQCGFCHQQGSVFTRAERSPELWNTSIERMVRYGSRLPTDLQKTLPAKLSQGYRILRENPSLLEEPAPWPESSSKLMITEWPIGDAMSQTHDMLIGLNKKVYVADNIQDRLYETDTMTNAITVYKIPHNPGDKPGGLIAGRLKDFPKHDSTSNAHSLAQSKVDGHIFITPSAQKRLVEFDPEKKIFTLHEMSEGFYPHTIRMDQQDRVWFTLALSNQVAMFDRKTKQFTYYDLPSRSFKEKLITKNIGLLFKLISWGFPLSNWLPIDWNSTGTPLVYGIDVTPDGIVWVARLHSKEIGRIDPATGSITMIETPFLGPRRLRTDTNGNLWITSFAESKIAKYEPKSGSFSMYDIPVKPLGSETPYALNVDKKREVVWVTGNQSDSLYSFDIKTEKWNVIPLPRRVTFTRDIEIDDDGTLYTSNSNFPSWHIEGSQPTLIRVEKK